MADAARQVLSASLSLLAAYAFVRLSYYRRFSVEHLRRDRFALYLVGYSLLFYVLGEVMAQFIPDYTPAKLEPVRDGLRAAGITTPVVNALFVGLVFAAGENLRVLQRMRRDVAIIDDKCKLRERCRLAAVALFIRKSHDATLRTVFRAAVLQKSLMVTLKSHKVYVGKPYFPLLDDPTGDLRALKLLVSQSGYRDKETKKVTLRTNYESLRDRLREAPANESGASGDDKADPLRSDIVILVDQHGDRVASVDLEDFGTVIAWAEVESLTIFDANVYRAFQEQAPTT